MLGGGFWNIIIVITVAFIPGFARVARAQTLSVKHEPYVEAAIAMGVRTPVIIFRHIVPNIMAPVVVLMMLWVASAIRLEASLSFLGIGTQPPNPSWGNIIRDGLNNLFGSPWPIIARRHRDHPRRAVVQPGRRRGARRARPDDGRAGMTRMTAAERAPMAAAQPGTPVLEVRDLRTAFRTRDGWLPIVKGISFEIGARQTLAVVGESGSGKSVTALSIMRLLAPETSRIEGSVKLSGRELLTLAEPQMREVRGRQIGMVFQEAMTSLNPLATVGNQIAEVLTIHGQMTGSAARAEAVRLLERVRIPAARSRANDLPHSLSGGMRQRVMIAMALACRPQLLIADEPTTALDVTIQAQILALIKELQHEEGMGVLFITHDMGVVAEIADRTVVMLGGEAVEQDRTEAIFASAQSAYTKILIAAVPRLGTMQGVGQPQHFPIARPRHRDAEGPDDAARYRRPRRPPGARRAQPRQALRHGERALQPGRRPGARRRGRILRPARAARRSRSSASRAAASRRPAAPSCASSSRRRGRSCSTGPTSSRSTRAGCATCAATSR